MTRREGEEEAAPGALHLRLDSLRLPREPGAMAEALQAALARALARHYAGNGDSAGKGAGMDAGPGPADPRWAESIRQSGLRLAEALQGRLASASGAGGVGGPRPSEGAPAAKGARP